MAEIDLKKAKKVYKTICNTFDALKWTYKKYDDILAVESGVKGKSTGVDFKITTEPNNQIIILYAKVPFVVSEEKRIDLAVAVTTANCNVLHGAFEYNFVNGEIFFKIATAYCDCSIGKQLIEYLVMYSVSIVERYANKFYQISLDKLSVAQFVKEQLNV